MNRKNMILMALFWCPQYVCFSMGPSLGGDVSLQVHQQIAQMRNRLDSLTPRHRKQLEKIGLATCVLQHEQGCRRNLIETFYYEDTGEIVFFMDNVPCKRFIVRYLTAREASTMCRYVNRYLNSSLPRGRKSLQQEIGLAQDEKLTKEKLRQCMRAVIPS